MGGPWFPAPVLRRDHPPAGNVPAQSEKEEEALRTIGGCGRWIPNNGCRSAWLPTSTTWARALDHLADGFEVPAAPPEGEAQTAPGAVQTLVGHWKSMSKDDKEQFVDRVTISVVEVVAASAALPVGLKLGKKTAKATGKVIRKRAKTIKKDAKKTVVVAAPSEAQAEGEEAVSRCARRYSLRECVLFIAFRTYFLTSTFVALRN